MAKWSLSLLDIWNWVQLFAQDSTARWGPEQRTLVANEVIADVAMKTKCYMDSAQQNIVAAQAAYDLPAGCPDIGCVHKVWVSGNLVDRIDRAKLARLDKWGQTWNEGVYRWYARAGKIYLTPVPPQNVTNGMDVEFAGLPDTITADADPCPLTVKLHMAVVRGCASRVLEADERWDAAKQQGLHYISLLSRFVLEGGGLQEPPQEEIVAEDEGPLPRTVAT